MDAYLCLLHLTAGIVVGECGYQVQCSVAPVGRISPSYFSHAPTDHGHSLCSASFWKLEVPSSSSLNHAGAESLFHAFRYIFSLLIYPVSLPFLYFYPPPMQVRSRCSMPLPRPPSSSLSSSPSLRCATCWPSGRLGGLRRRRRAGTSCAGTCPSSTRDSVSARASLHAGGVDCNLSCVEVCASIQC